ncbi:MAG: beta/gamma crystallin-related protein [Thermomonas sp.]
MKVWLKSMLGVVVGVVVAGAAVAEVTFYEREGFAGRSFTASQQVPAFERYGFSDRASSAVVVGERWEVCQDTRYGGRCVVLRPGNYPSLAAMGLTERVSSARAVSSDARVDDRRYAPAPVVAAEVSLFEREGFDGRAFRITRQVANLQRSSFNDRAASAVVVGARYEVCDDVGFRGRCVVLRPGRYASLAAIGLGGRIASVRAVPADARLADHRYAPPPVAGQVSFYEREGFDGRHFTTEEQVADFRQYGFNDRASSAVVLGDRYEACDDARFGGRCVILRPGRYPSLAAMGLNGRISSVRPVPWNARVGDDRYAPAPVPVYDSRRRGGERLYEANVTSVRAVLATSGQRCWIERETVPQPQGRGDANVPAAIAGACGE